MQMKRNAAAAAITELGERFVASSYIVFFSI